jgi:hypothetical protein
MVEGTIFLDEDDDVLDVGQFGTNGWTGGTTSTPASRQKQPREPCCSSAHANFQQFSTSNILRRHGELYPLLSLRWIGEADPPRANSPCKAVPVIEWLLQQEHRGLQDSCAELDNPPAWLPSMSKAFRM